MCGIIGYTGGRQATPILIGGLRKLEYRGYDSAGIALVDDAGARCGRRVVGQSGVEVRELARALLGEHRAVGD